MNSNDSERIQVNLNSNLDSNVLNMKDKNKKRHTFKTMTLIKASFGKDLDPILVYMLERILPCETSLLFWEQFFHRAHDKVKYLAVSCLISCDSFWAKSFVRLQPLHVAQGLCQSLSAMPRAATHSFKPISFGKELTSRSGTGAVTVSVGNAVKSKRCYENDLLGDTRGRPRPLQREGE